LHSGVWKRDSQLPSVVHPSPAITATDAAAARRGTAATCDDGRNMKWTNACEKGCCRTRTPPNATCLQRANTSLLVLGFSLERTLWFDMMYFTSCIARASHRPRIFITT
jgi:hypothetical protein